MLNALQINQEKIMPYRPFHRAIDETLKTPEKCWTFLCLNLPEYGIILQFSSASPRLLPPAYVYKETTVFVICESLSISVRRLGDFVARFCQPSGNVFENKMTSFQ